MRCCWLMASTLCLLTPFPGWSASFDRPTFPGSTPARSLAQACQTPALARVTRHAIAPGETVELGFIRKRRQTDGRSFWLQVTEKFHQYFQLNQDQTLELTQYLNREKKQNSGEAVAVAEDSL